jgi:hypothetical protein
MGLGQLLIQVRIVTHVIISSLSLFFYFSHILKIRFFLFLGYPEKSCNAVEQVTNLSLTCSQSFAIVVQMRFVSLVALVALVALVSVVSPGELVHTKGRTIVVMSPILAMVS